jgi:uncharacterized membrane protein YraQ (UPF0718 family)
VKGKHVVFIAAVFAYTLFLSLSWIIGFGPGREISQNFVLFFLDMLKVLPCAFILIGLFETWVKKETVEKHFGEKSGILGYVWGILLAGTTVGGLYVAFPVSYSLYRKGARLGVIFAYIGASGVCRIPMTIFEASFMGVKFSVIRLVFALPLVILSSMFLGNYLTKRRYSIIEPQ